jgi:hypothetical protein
LPNLSSVSYFGISRKSRRIAFEASLLSTIPGEWKKTNLETLSIGEISELHNDNLNQSMVQYDTLEINSNLRNLGIGDYMCIRYRPIPYVYFKSNRAIYSSDIDYRYLKVIDESK